MKSLKSLINSAGIGSLRKMKKNELLQVANIIRKSLRSRRKTFEKYDSLKAIPEEYRDVLPSNADFENRNEIISWLSDSLQYLRTPESTYKGYQKAVADRMAAYNETLSKSEHHREQFKTIEDFDRFGTFMKEAAERFLDFQKASDQVYEMYEQAQRLGVDPNQFLKNYDYWEKHLEKLQEAETINWSRTGKPVYASDYARQLHLPSMRSEYEDMPVNENLVRISKRKRRK